MNVCDESDVGIPAARFGDALRSHRRAAGLTQEELAERAGVSPRSISGMERGEGATPRRDTVALLARALDLTAADRAELEALLVRGRSQGPRLVRDHPGGNERPHNLPRSLDSFIDRESDIRELGPALAAAPLMTLLGAGGMGKTRLARELARRTVGDF